MAASQPQLGRGLKPPSGVGDQFIDLGPVSKPGPVSLTSNPAVRRANPADAARRRTEALVRAQGGIKALEKAAREKTRKRISENVARSASKKAKPS